MFTSCLKIGEEVSLTEVQWSKIIDLHQEGYLKRQISLAEKCSKTAVHNTLVKFKTSGNCLENKLFGRP